VQHTARKMGRQRDLSVFRSRFRITIVVIMVPSIFITNIIVNAAATFIPQEIKWDRLRVPRIEVSVTFRMVTLQCDPQSDFQQVLGDKHAQ
jgi:hypothetical protein